MRRSKLLERGELSEGHGRALLQVSDQDARASLAKQAAAEGWSVRETEDRTRAGGKGSRKPAAKGGRISAEERAAMTDAEDALGEALGADVRVRRAGDGRQGRAPLRRTSTRSPPSPAGCAAAARIAAARAISSVG